MFSEQRIRSQRIFRSTWENTEIADIKNERIKQILCGYQDKAIGILASNTTVQSSVHKCLFTLWKLIFTILRPVAEFKEFERRFKFKPRFKYGWTNLKLYQMFKEFKPALNLNRGLADLNRGSNSLNSISVIL